MAGGRCSNSLGSGVLWALIMDEMLHFPVVARALVIGPSSKARSLLEKCG